MVPPSLHTAAQAAASSVCIDFMVSLLFATVVAEVTSLSRSPNGVGTGSMEATRSGGAADVSSSLAEIEGATTAGGSSGGRKN